MVFYLTKCLDALLFEFYDHTSLPNYSKSIVSHPIDVPCPCSVPRQEALNRIVITQDHPCCSHVSKNPKQCCARKYLDGYHGARNISKYSLLRECIDQRILQLRAI